MPTEVSQMSEPKLNHKDPFGKGANKHHIHSCIYTLCPARGQEGIPNDVTDRTRSTDLGQSRAGVIQSVSQVMLIRAVPLPHLNTTIVFVRRDLM